MAYISAMKDLRPDVIFGPAYKGIPLAVAIALLLGGNMGYAYNRKEEKNHGDGGLIVGASLKERKVAIVDDVMTTGTSSSEAFKIIRANEGIPTSCIIAFDRQERGDGEVSAVQEFEENFKIPVYPAATLADLIEVLQETTINEGDAVAGEILENILTYQQEYGV